MTTKIFKYPLIMPSDRIQIQMPKNAKVLSVQIQDGRPRLWAIVDDTEPLEEKSFSVFGTGHPLPDNLGNFVGTFQMGTFVWHLFEAAK